MLFSVYSYQTTSLLISINGHIITKWLMFIHNKLSSKLVDSLVVRERDLLPSIFLWISCLMEYCQNRGTPFFIFFVWMSKIDDAMRHLHWKSKNSCSQYTCFMKTNTFLFDLVLKFYYKRLSISGIFAVLALQWFSITFFT